MITKAEIIDLINQHMPTEPIEANYKGEVASRFRYLDGSGEIGVISSVSDAFCASCNRARLSARGELFTCLFASSGYDVRKLVRGGLTDDELTESIASVWRNRTDQYSIDRALSKTDGKESGNVLYRRMKKSLPGQGQAFYSQYESGLFKNTGDSRNI